MELKQESLNLGDLKELAVVDYSHPLIRKKSDELFLKNESEIDKVKKAYEFVRDQISHTWDIQSSRVTCHASEVLLFREGICYAKSNLLAAHLRSEGIPTGFCYQRLMLFDTPDKGYCLHTLNAVFLASVNRWIRLDARGNKPGIQAEFSIEEEKLAFPIHEHLNEIDYPTIYLEPNPKTISTLKSYKDALIMYQIGLPTTLP